MYKFIGKGICGVPTQAFEPVLEEFKKQEDINNRIYKIIEKEIFPFLLANGIEPVIISGSPQEALDIYKDRLHCSIIGIQYATRNGKYTEECISNTAVAEGKTKAIDNFLAESPNTEIVFGFGDSESDIPILKAATLGGFVNSSNHFLEKNDINYLDFNFEQTGEKIIISMTLKLLELDHERFEALATVNPKTGKTTPIPVNRKYFYSGACKNKWVCGVQVFVLDTEGNAILIRRSTKEEQASGKVATMSEHVQFYRPDDSKQRESITQGYIRGLYEELGIPVDNIHTPRTYYVLYNGEILRPGNTGDGCGMRVENYVAVISPIAQIKIQEDEVSEVFKVPWPKAKEKFENGTYIFHGTNMQKVLEYIDEIYMDIMRSIGDDLAIFYMVPATSLPDLLKQKSTLTKLSDEFARNNNNNINNINTLS